MQKGSRGALGEPVAQAGRGDLLPVDRGPDLVPAAAGALQGAGDREGGVPDREVDLPRRVVGTGADGGRAVDAGRLAEDGPGDAVDQAGLADAVVGDDEGQPGADVGAQLLVAPPVAQEDPPDHGSASSSVSRSTSARGSSSAARRSSAA